MNIEVIEFYLLEQNEKNGALTGTLRIKIPEIGIHILGIHVSKRKDSWFFILPGRTGTHHQTKEAVRYPFFVFENRDKQRALMQAIREKAPSFIEKRVADTENPLTFPQKQQLLKQSEQTKKCYNKSAEKEIAAISHLKLKKSIVMKEWVDPPKRKAFSKMNHRNALK